MAPTALLLCSISTRGFRTQIATRPVRKDDFPAWLKLWEGYNAFYGRLGETALASEVIGLLSHDLMRRLPADLVPRPAP